MLVGNKMYFFLLLEIYKAYYLKNMEWNKYMVINSASEIIFFVGFGALSPQGVTDKICLHILLYFNRFIKIADLFFLQNTS